MNEATFLGKPIVFGTFFLGEYTEATGKPFAEAMNDIDRNPFKFIPLFLQVGINTTAELNGTEKVELKEVLAEVDRLGIASDEIQKVLQVFVQSIQAKVDTAKKKKAPSRKK